MFFAYVQKSRDIYIVYIGGGKIRDKSDESLIKVFVKSLSSFYLVSYPLPPISLCYRGHHRAHRL